MKTLKNIRKKKLILIQDPQRSALNQLASFSEQTSIPLTVRNKQPESWFIDSFQSFQKTESQNCKTARNSNLFKSSFFKNNQRFRKNLLSERQPVEKSLQLQKITSKQKSKNRQNQLVDLLKQKKSLSLTNYILIDKRKLNSLNPKNNMKIDKYKNLIKLLHHRCDKKFLTHKQKNTSIYQKTEELPLLSTKNSKFFNLNQQQNQNTNKRKYISRKQQFSVKLKIKQKQQQSLKESQQTILSPSILWLKAPIHDYLKKFIC